MGRENYIVLRDIKAYKYKETQLYRSLLWTALSIKLSLPIMGEGRGEGL